MTLHTIPELIQGVTSLISLPDIGLKVSDMLAGEDASSEDVAAVIASDPALTAALLRLANSSAMSRGKSIDSVGKAITRLGTSQVEELTLGISVARSFQGVPNELVSVEDFWKHSLYCAAASRAIAERLRVPQRDAAFTAGLLHDIGQLVMFTRLPDESRDFLTLSMNEYDGLLTHRAEREVLGFDHTEVGSELAKLWHFPDILCQCIRGHHELFAIDPCPPLVMVVHIANSLAVLAELDSVSPDDAPPTEERAWTELGLSTDAIPEIVALCRDEIGELMGAFAPA